MSSSQQQPSNNSNNNNSGYQNQFSDYETDESVNSQRYPQQQQQQQQTSGQSYGNDFFQQMYPFQDDADEDIPNEIIAELDARNRIQSNVNDDDESVFSDVVQDAFKKYQNEFSKYWTYDETIWDNKFSDEDFFDDEQEELYAQMEECWKYITQDNNHPDPPKPSADQSQLSTLNPDATEFKPSWLKSSPGPTNEELPIFTTSSQVEEAPKKI